MASQQTQQGVARDATPSLSSRASSVSDASRDLDMEVFSSTLLACGFTADRVAESVRLFKKENAPQCHHEPPTTTATSDGSSVTTPTASAHRAHRLDATTTATVLEDTYAEGSQFRMTSSTASHASTVEASNDRGTNDSAQLSHHAATVRRDVDGICKGLEAIEHLYDRAHFTVSSQASSNRAAGDGMPAEVVHKKAAAPGSLVYPEDASNALRSQYVMHEDWCPASRDGSHGVNGRCNRRDEALYYDPLNVVSWVKHEFGPRRSNNSTHARHHVAATCPQNVILGDATFSLPGDPAYVWRSTTTLSLQRSRRPTMVAGGYKMALPIHEQPVHFAADKCPSSLPRCARVDRVARINAYRASWTKDAAVVNVLGKRDETSWKTRVSLDDYRRMV